MAERARSGLTGLLLLVGAAACASGGAKGGRGAKDAGLPDSLALAVETEVKARTVRVVLAERLRPEAMVEAISVDRFPGGEIVARGSATLHLRKLKVEAAEELRLVFLADHEDILLHARDVAVFKQVKGYGHRTEDADMVTMANDQVSIFQQER